MANSTTPYRYQQVNNAVISNLYTTIVLVILIPGHRLVIIVGIVMFEEGDTRVSLALPNIVISHIIYWGETKSKQKLVEISPEWISLGVKL